MKASLTSPSTRGAVAEVADHCHVALGIAGADEAVAFHAHRVAGGMEGLRPDDDGVEMESALLRVPATKINSTEQGQQVQRVDAQAPGHTVFSIGGEDEVLLAERAAGAYLRCLLAQTGSPQPQFALALQGGCLGIDPTGQHHVVIEALDLIIVAAEGVLGVFQPLTLRGEQLDQLNLSARTADVAHGCILSSPDAVVPHLIGPGAGSPRWVVPPPSGALVSSGSLRVASGLDWLGLLVGGTGQPKPKVPPSLRTRENHLYVLSL